MKKALALIIVLISIFTFSCTHRYHFQISQFNRDGYIGESNVNMTVVDVVKEKEYSYDGESKIFYQKTFNNTGIQYSGFEYSSFWSVDKVYFAVGAGKEGSNLLYTYLANTMSIPQTHDYSETRINDESFLKLNLNEYAEVKYDIFGNVAHLQLTNDIKIEDKENNVYIIKKGSYFTLTELEDINEK